MKNILKSYLREVSSYSRNGDLQLSLAKNHLARYEWGKALMQVEAALEVSSDSKSFPEPDFSIVDPSETPLPQPVLG